MASLSIRHWPRSRLDHRQPLRAQRAGRRARRSAARSRAATRTARRSGSRRRRDSTIDAAPTTCPPAALATSIVSRVDPPVVITSSTTSTRSVLSSVKPRRSVSLPSCRSAKMARTPSARPTSCPITTPPSAGDSTTVGPQIAHAVGNRAAERLGLLRVLQHQRALQIARAVQPGGQTEVTFEQRARSPVQIKKLVACHGV